MKIIFAFVERIYHENSSSLFRLPSRKTKKKKVGKRHVAIGKISKRKINDSSSLSSNAKFNFSLFTLYTMLAWPSEQNETREHKWLWPPWLITHWIIASPFVFVPITYPRVFLCLCVLFLFLFLRTSHSLHTNGQLYWHFYFPLNYTVSTRNVPVSYLPKI